MVFSCVLDMGFKSKKSKYEKIFVFTKFRDLTNSCDLIYIDIKNVGCVIIPLEDLLKNKLLKMYYDLSLQLTTRKNLVIEEQCTEYNRSTFKYEKKNGWFIDSAYFVENYYTAAKKIETGRYYCTYNIDPKDLRNKGVSGEKDIAQFFSALNVRYGYTRPKKFNKMFNKMFIDYTNLMLEYNIASIEEELEKLSASPEDNKNIMVLLELNNKKDMNSDIFRMLYGLVVSKEGQRKYAPPIVT